MTHTEALAFAADLLTRSRTHIDAPAESHAAGAALIGAAVAYARELRESGAMQPAEQPKPAAGPWEPNAQGYPKRQSGRNAIAVVRPEGWYVWPPFDGGAIKGPETGDEGKRLADEAARRFYTLED